MPWLGSSNRVWVMSVWLALAAGPSAYGQETDQQQDVEQGQPEHAHMQRDMKMDGGWQFMQDGVLFAVFNHQGTPRGGSEFVVPNWWMGMAQPRDRAWASDVHQHVQPRCSDRRHRRLPGALSGGRGVE